MRLLALTAFAALALATPALADPCEAIPDKGPMPAGLARGQTFSGQVRYIGDGDSLCVGGPAPASWIEIRIQDFYAPELKEPGGREAKAALDRIAYGRTVTCTVQTVGRVRSYDRVVAACRLNGVSLADLMRRRGIVEGGRGRAATAR